MQLTFSHRDTWLHGVNPSLKLVMFMLLFIAIILIHNPTIMLNITIGTLLLLVWTGHPWKRLLLYASPFILVFISTSTGMMFFGTGETTWWRFGLVHITEESFYRGIHLGLRALAMAASGLLFGLTTRPVRLFYSLMQQWRLSPKYAYSFLAAMRMVPIVIEEFQTLRHALKVRGTQRRGWFVGLYNMLRMYAIPLLAQSIRRAQRVAIAMEAKQFASETKRTYYYLIGYSLKDVVFILYFAIVVVLAYLLGGQYAYFGITDVR